MRLRLRLNKKAQSLAIGGVFMVVLLSLIIVALLYDLRTLSNFYEKIHESSVRDREMIIEKLVLSKVIYYDESSPNASSVATYEVINGRYVSGNTSSLNAIDNNQLVFESYGGTAGGIISENLIKNGGFSNDFKYWHTYAYNGYWSSTNGYAEFIAFYLPLGSLYYRQHKVVIYRRSVTSYYGSLTQYFSMSNYEVVSATFSFKYKIEKEGSIPTIVIEINSHRLTVKPLKPDSRWHKYSTNISVSWLNSGEKNTFKISVSGNLEPSTWFTDVSIDNVKLIVTYKKSTGYTFVTNLLEVIFKINSTNSIEGNVSLYFKFNTSDIGVSIYAFNNKRNVWVLKDSILADTESVFSNTTLSSDYLENGTLEIMVYATSPQSFEAYFDYLGIWLYTFNSTKLVIKVYNAGVNKITIFSIWLINSTDHLRFNKTADIFPGETKHIELTNVRLSRDSEYLLRVISYRGNRYELRFTTP